MPMPHRYSCSMDGQLESPPIVLRPLPAKAASLVPPVAVGTIHTREERLEHRLTATASAAFNITDRRNVLVDDDEYIIVRRSAIDMAQGVARRNLQDLKYGLL